MCNICPESVLTLLLLLSFAQSMLRCVITEQTMRLLHNWTQLSGTAALGSVSLQISYQEVQNAISRRQGCLFGVTGRHGPNVHASAKTNPPPPIMAYHRFYFICFICFPGWRRHICTRKKTNGWTRAITAIFQVHSCFLFPGPVIMGSGCAWIDPSLLSAGAD